MILEALTCATLSSVLGGAPVRYEVERIEQENAGREQDFGRDIFVGPHHDVIGWKSGRNGPNTSFHWEVHERADGVFLYDLEEGDVFGDQRLRRVLDLVGDELVASAFNESNTAAALLVLDVATGAEKRRITFPEAEYAIHQGIRTIDIHSGSVLISFPDGRVILFDYQSGAQQREFHADELEFVPIGEDVALTTTHVIASAQETNGNDLVYVFDRSTGTQLAALEHPDAASVNDYGVRVIANDNFVAVYSRKPYFLSTFADQVGDLSVYSLSTLEFVYLLHNTTDLGNTVSDHHYGHLARVAGDRLIIPNPDITRRNGFEVLRFETGKPIMYCVPEYWETRAGSAGNYQFGVVGDRMIAGYIEERIGNWLGAGAVYVFDLSENPADLNGDGFVDAIDLATLLAGWGTPVGDIDGDSVVGSGDLAVLLSGWSQ